MKDNDVVKLFKQQSRSVFKLSNLRACSCEDNKGLHNLDVPTHLRSFLFGH